MPTTRSRLLVVVAAAATAAAVTAAPAQAHTPAAADVTEAVGFSGALTNVRACTGAVVILPSASVTTFPPSVAVQQLAVARSTCAGTLAGATSYIDVGMWQGGVQIVNTRCAAEDCVVPVPKRTGRTDVVVDFHWTLASGTWNVQEPTACLPGATATAIRCTALTTTYL
jgi:hypothetical protein